MNSSQLISSLNDKKIISISAGDDHSLAMNGKNQFISFSISNLFFIQKKMENALVGDGMIGDN